MGEADIRPIVVHHYPLSETRTKERPCQWRAECGIGGKTWVETSRSGATHALARTLKKAGLQDAGFEIHEQDRSGYLSVPSFYEWAEWTYNGERRVKYDVQQASLERLRAAE